MKDVYKPIPMKTNVNLLFYYLIFAISTAKAQIPAVTETGEEVILHNNGTWEYLNKTEFEKNVIPTNSTKFKKDKDATFVLKSNRINVGIHLDPKKWSFNKGIENGDSEYELQLKNEDLYAMIITEKVEIPIENLRSIALENGRAAAPDLTIVKEEYRKVNGIKVLLLQMNGTIQGIKFTYYGYYYSSPNGTLQFITYTAQNLLDTYLVEIEQLLNGLVVINE